MSSRWDQIQKKSFLEWINHHLAARSIKVNSLDEFEDGLYLVALLEVLSQKEVKRYEKNPRFLSHKIDNVSICLHFMKHEMGITVVGCNPQDIVGGNLKQIMGVIFLLIQRTKHTHDIDIISDIESSSELTTPREMKFSESESKSETQDSPTKVKELLSAQGDTESEQEPTPEPDDLQAKEEEAAAQVAKQVPITGSPETSVVQQLEKTSSVPDVQAEADKPSPAPTEQSLPAQEQEPAKEAQGEGESQQEKVENLDTTTDIREDSPAEAASDAVQEDKEENIAVREQSDQKKKQRKKTRTRSKKMEKITKMPNDTEKEDKQQRRTIANEVLSTERSYVAGLNVLYNSFLQPLKEKNLCSAAELRRIFSDIEVLIGFNKMLLQRLEERMANWDTCERLGDVFVKEVAYLKMYTTYVNNYNSSVHTVTECKKNSKQFAEFLEKARYSEPCGGLDLTSFLIMPVQRIPRYVLLLGDLLKHTPETHEDYTDLKQAVGKMREVADYVNEKKREAENLNQVLSVQELLAGKVELLEDASRRYVREGPLVDTSGSEKKNRYFFLFNDTLVGANMNNKDFREIWKQIASGEMDNKYVPTGIRYKFTLHLGNTGLKEMGSAVLGLSEMTEKWKNAFQLVAPLVPAGLTKRTNTIQQFYTFLAPSYESKLSWMTDIDDCICQQLEAKRTRLGTLPPLEESNGDVNFANAEIESKMFMRNKHGAWVERYARLVDGVMYWFKAKEDKEPKGKENILNGSVRLHRPSDKENAFQILTQTQIRYFATETPEKMFDWINTVRAAIEFSLNNRQAQMTAKERLSGLPPEVADILTQPDNQVCADCGEENPRWTQLDLGVIVCTECSGIHRMQGGTSVIKCLSFGKWTPAQVEQISSKGNHRVNEGFEKNVPSFMAKPAPNASYSTKLQYIQAKYYNIVPAGPTQPDAAIRREASFDAKAEEQHDDVLPASDSQEKVTDTDEQETEPQEKQEQEEEKEIESEKEKQEKAEKQEEKVKRERSDKKERQEKKVKQEKSDKKEKAPKQEKVEKTEKAEKKEKKPEKTDKAEKKEKEKEKKEKEKKEKSSEENDTDESHESPDSPDLKTVPESPRNRSSIKTTSITLNSNSPKERITKERPAKEKDAKEVKEAATPKKTAGWLTIMKSLREQQKYYFVIKKAQIVYYKNEKLGSAKGTIDLASCSVNTKGWNSEDFEIITPSKIYTLRCSSVEERNQWVESIKLFKSGSGTQKGKRPGSGVLKIAHSFRSKRPE